MTLERLNDADLVVRLGAKIGMAGHELAILGLLMLRREVSLGAIIHAMYGDRADGGPDDPLNVLRTYIVRLRRRGRTMGFEVRCLHGYGYAVSARDQRLLRALVEDEDGE